MGGTNKSGGFIGLNLILFILFIELIRIVFSLSKNAFIGEFLIIIVLLIMSVSLLTGVFKGRSWAWPFSTLLFGTVLLNILLLYFVIIPYDIHLILTAAALLGFFISIVRLGSAPTSYPLAEEIEDFDSGDVPTDDIDEPIEDEVILEEIKPLKEYKPIKSIKSFSPGKYVASKRGSTYHSPKCNWAKKIKENSRVWLNDKPEAKKKGYKKCNFCVK